MSPTLNKLAIFIDSANLYATAKMLGFDVDYRRLLKELCLAYRECRLLALRGYLAG
jgi:uncharacterized LabA/DUF88 family protein